MIKVDHDDQGVITVIRDKGCDLLTEDTKYNAPLEIIKGTKIPIRRSSQNL
jgi:hypothetical protein